MNWKETLQKLEQQHLWDHAIEFMQHTIKNNQDDKDAYMCMNYLLMNLIVEENYEKAKRDYYWKLTKWYFDESYQKFSDNAEYLYITGKTAVMGPWFFGINEKDYEAMIDKAHMLDPENLTYKEPYYWDLFSKNPKILSLSHMHI